ncbi:hematopoietic death receptor isoform X1 [Seriola aureovittata]|uniref:hematopoietic death receptor isoform X1 n=1 Tax=Seriola aureovittata TaxID=2871759 RepID=UPI0024BEF9BA|nr:hematopoietic death receptor isoform X1 [Seriola aureovittata]
MIDFKYAVIFILMLSSKPTDAFPRSGLDLRGSRTQRDVPCSASLEYQHGNICCLNCPAGTRVESPCTGTREKGRCEECEHGDTYTEHSNGLNMCFKCTRCRSDQEMVTECNQTHNTECRCKSGKFCAPDQACEVCKKCSSCEKDEEIVRNCTSTTNTECKKIQSSSGTSRANAAIVVPLTLLASGLIILGAVCCWKKRNKATDSQRPDGKAGQRYPANFPTEERKTGETKKPSWQLVRPKSSAGTEDERKVLCESLNSSASNSQHSLTSLPSSAFPVPPPQVSAVVPRQPNRREEWQFPKLVPLKGEDSLRKCFDYFEEELEVDYHKKFFRHLGLNDNVIKSKENLHYEDRVHELLNIWLEKVGREASLNYLLSALIDLNQRRTAENIRDRAIVNDHYIYENQIEVNSV